VITPGSDPRVHGYSAEDDLARHYTYSESVFLCLAGKLPSRSIGRAFDIAMQYLGPVAVTEAPTHAAVIAKLVRSKTSAILGAASVALGEAARETMLELSPLLAWLEEPAHPFPAAGRAASQQARASVTRLRDLIESTGVASPIFDQDPSRLAALVGIMYACGLTTALQIQLAMAIAQLPFVVAEAMAAPSYDLKGYPMNLPRVRYCDDTDNGDA
jgi:hypothetical protein